MSVGVMFIIDSTGSMRWIHRELCDNLQNIVVQFENEGVPVRFSMVGFRDYIANSSNWIEFVDFTSEETVEVFTNWLSNLKAKGGGDNDGESSLAGAVYGMEQGHWPDVKRKVLAIFTDDNPHVPDFGIESWEGLHQCIKDNEIDQIHLFIDAKHVDGFDDLDSHGYDVIRHILVKDNRNALEKSIRAFVKISSTGFDSEIEIIEREDAINPFDSIDDELIPDAEVSADFDANPFDDY